MRSFSEIRESPNFQRLKDSVEFKAERTSLLVVGIFFLVMTLFIVPLRETSERNAVHFVLYIVLFVPMLLYQLYRLIRIFFHMDSYTYTEAVLDRPRQGYKGAMYFTVRLRDRYGKEFEADTISIFSRGTPNFEDYVNQKALIGYNDKTELVVVIKKLP